MDPETGGPLTSELFMVVGPHWPFALAFTGGLIVAFPAASIFIFWGVVPVWACAVLVGLTGATLLLLAWLGCSDPGIARRIANKPTNGPAALQKWMWNDQGTEIDRRLTFECSCATTVLTFAASPNLAALRRLLSSEHVAFSARLVQPGDERNAVRRGPHLPIYGHRYSKKKHGAVCSAPGRRYHSWFLNMHIHRVGALPWVSDRTVVSFPVLESAEACVQGSIPRFPPPLLPLTVKSFFATGAPWPVDRVLRKRS